MLTEIHHNGRHTEEKDLVEMSAGFTRSAKDIGPHPQSLYRRSQILAIMLYRPFAIRFLKKRKKIYDLRHTLSQERRDYIHWSQGIFAGHRVTFCGYGYDETL